MNSRNKGKRGELEFAKLLKAAGFEARRGQQFAGGNDSPDVVSNIPFIHWEVKRVEQGNVYDWLYQAMQDADCQQIPVVAHRKNDRQWMAILSMADFLALISMISGLTQ